MMMVCQRLKSKWETPLIRILIAALTVGFEQREIVVEESLSQQILISVLTLEGQSQKDIVVGIQTQEDTATGWYILPSTRWPT